MRLGRWIEITVARRHHEPSRLSADERARRRVALLAVALVLAAAGIIVFLTLRGSDFKTLAGPEGDPFTIEYSSKWQPLVKKKLGLLPGPPLGALRRGNNEGFLAVQRQDPFKGGLRKFTAGLNKDLKRTVGIDFKGGQGKLVQTRAGTGFLYSYHRAARYTTYIVALVPAGDRSYTLNGFFKQNIPGTRSETEKMVRSFDTD